MARATFGDTAADYVVTVAPSGVLRVGAAELTFWSAKTEGTQHTDLLLNGSPVTSIPVPDDGSIPEFQGPDGVTVLWADAGGSERTRLVDSSGATSVPKSLVDAKGDLFVGTAADAVGRLAVGANGALLVPDSAQATGWKFSAATYREGTGSPEGVVTAPVGSRYIDTAATNGAVEWIKASGTGNTGWQVVYGDTGKRNVDALFANGWTGFGCIRRNGRLVEMYVTSLDGSAATSNTFFTLPAGFLDNGTSAGSPQSGVHSGTNMQPVSVVYSSGAVSTAGRPTAGTWRAQWMTNEAWPASLPGTAA